MLSGLGAIPINSVTSVEGDLGLGLTTPKASPGTLHNSELHKWQSAVLNTAYFGFETSKVDAKGDFPQTTARSKPSLLVTR